GHIAQVRRSIIVVAPPHNTSRPPRPRAPYRRGRCPRPPRLNNWRQYQHSDKQNTSEQCDDEFRHFHVLNLLLIQNRSRNSPEYGVEELMQRALSADAQSRIWPKETIIGRSK